MTIYECPDCKNTYEHNEHWQCPRCRASCERFIKHDRPYIYQFLNVANLPSSFGYATLAQALERALSDYIERLQFKRQAAEANEEEELNPDDEVGFRPTGIAYIHEDACLLNQEELETWIRVEKMKRR